MIGLLGVAAICASVGTVFTTSIVAGKIYLALVLLLAGWALVVAESGR